jgi:hypothetical protein
MTQEEHDYAIEEAYKLGCQMGKVERRNRTLTGQLTESEKEVLRAIRAKCSHD